MAFPNYVGLDFGEAYRVTSARTGNLQLGQIGFTPDGNVWRYSQASSVQVAAGLFVTSITTPTNEQTVTIAHAIGVETVTVTASGISADDFRDGYLVVTAGAGNGETHRIRTNTATVSGLITVSFFAGDGLTVAWSTSTTDVDLFIAPFSALVICPTGGQQLAVALTQRIIPASNFFWGLARGYGAVLIDGADADDTGLELDEKNLVQSLTHAGQGFLDDTPDATAILAGYRQVLGYLVKEANTRNDEQGLCAINLL